jgi:hypothetical protein
MSQKEKSVEENKQPPVDRVATTFAATEKSFADLEAKSATMRREIREQSEAYARAQEERQRAAAQWDYEEEQRRRAVLDKQREDDRERDRRYAEREAAIAAREKQVHITLAELLGIASDPFDSRAAAKALEDKLTKAEAKGKTIAEQMAAKDYATKKSIDDATAAKDLALLQSDNARLKSDNAKLEADNKRLSEANMELAKRSGDLALGAFNAAGGLQGKATESLQAAAQGSPRLPNR